MRWVDDPTYFGSDRRKGRALRLRNRRYADHAGPPPSLPAALRQLAMRTLEVGSPAGLARFRERVSTTSKLAKEFGNTPVADVLMNLAGRLDAPRSADLRPIIETEIRRATLMLNAPSHSLR